MPKDILAKALPPLPGGRLFVLLSLLLLLLLGVLLFGCEGALVLAGLLLLLPLPRACEEDQK